MPRFVLLEHTGAPDDPTGLHYDLLLEQGPHCRTWRLADVPTPDGPEVIAFELPPHRLAWLDHEAGEVSGGRGFARRIDGGGYEPATPSEIETDARATVEVTVHGGRLDGRLVLRANDDRWLACLTAHREAADASAAAPNTCAATTRNAGDDWRRFDARAIPSKASTPRLDAFLEAVANEAGSPPLTLLDVGCGSGRLSRRIFERGFSVLGVDINPKAIDMARMLAVSADAAGRSLQFEVADFADNAPPRLDGGPFDVAVCQLVISIIGNVRQRANLLRHVHGNLRPGGRFFLSASGVSDTINPGYARLYVEDLPLTGERHTYLSRDASGEILYTTHHFTARELHDLLKAAGFEAITVVTERETSSRRPDEAAYFLYATCRSGR